MYGLEGGPALYYLLDITISSYPPPQPRKRHKHLQCYLFLMIGWSCDRFLRMDEGKRRVDRYN